MTAPPPKFRRRFRCATAHFHDLLGGGRRRDDDRGRDRRGVRAHLALGNAINALAQAELAVAAADGLRPDYQAVWIRLSRMCLTGTELRQLTMLLSHVALRFNCR